LAAAARFVVYGFFTAAVQLLMRPSSSSPDGVVRPEVLPGSDLLSESTPAPRRRNRLAESGFDRIGMAADAFAVSREQLAPAGTRRRITWRNLRKLPLCKRIGVAAVCSHPTRQCTVGVGRPGLAAGSVRAHASLRMCACTHLRSRLGRHLSPNRPAALTPSPQRRFHHRGFSATIP
jgi:hypothetical protein